MLLEQPDDLTAAALKRLAQSDSNFQLVLAWLQRSLAARDAANRSMIDSVSLRMGQGVAGTLAEIIGHAEGKQASKGALSDTSRPAARGNRTP